MYYNITNRRYTGSKAKLADWIMKLIESHCLGKSFCDLFAGTGVISERAMSKFDEVIINDLLFSNNLIYNAFFYQMEYDIKKLSLFEEKYKKLKVLELEENYVSKNFGGKFFSLNDSKMIGYIRQDIEDEKNNLNKKEYDILIASLIYSLDRSANTVGHFEAYFKNKNISDKFLFGLILPVDSKKNIKIYREDSNLLAEKIYSDIVYIDPPYNSRQYSRFYHVLENIVKWEKPKLYGVALKPQPENMSEYCRSDAPFVFENLINNLKCKYAVVSYNNTYTSKSKSSKNKIDLEFIEKTLKSKGSVLIFEKSHPHFNAGKTDFNDHKEYVFILKVSG